MTQVIHGLSINHLVTQVLDPSQTDADFENWIMRVSHGCADLHKNCRGEYDDPVTLGCLEQYRQRDSRSEKGGKSKTKGGF